MSTAQRQAHPQPHPQSRLQRFPGAQKCLAGWLTAALLATAPGPQQLFAAEAPAAPVLTIAQVLSSLRPDLARVADTEALARATAALQLASELKLPQASRAINEALQLDPRNSWLHFFNGLIYHLQARQGDTDKTNTAIEGYQQAIRFDPNNWIAQEFLGIAFVEQRLYVRAQAAFAEVLLTKPEDLDTLLRMMAASYLGGDAGTACTMADRVASLYTRQEPRLLRSSVSVYASCGDFLKSDAQRKAYLATGASAEDMGRLDQRVESWRVFHKSRTERAAAVAAAGSASALAAAPAANGEARMQKTQFTSGGGGGGYTPGAAPGGYGGGAAAGAVPTTASSSGETRMVLVDVVMVRTEDTIQTTKGVNLLGALSLQYGSATAPAYSESFNQTMGAESTTVLTRAITVPALTYSLNIANAYSTLNEVLARPTLAALEGMRSEFFSGTSLNAAVVSGGTGQSGSSVSLEKRYGVKLTVLPQILPNGMIKLAIDASRTFLKPPSSDIGFTYKLEISEILANANVVMRMGDTLILGGLSEKETTNTRDGVPGLQDIPIVQYFFSRQARTDYQKSVLILITPRPANYTWLSDASKAEFAKNPDDPFTPSMDVLRARYSDWFKPYPNLASVFHHLNAADLYREFRTGDVTLETWDRMDSTRSRLKQALGFLYY
jgi:tetratricopeptide (TPR) repeat protein